MSPGACIHYNVSILNARCSRGVAYEQFLPGLPCLQTMERSARGGTFLKAGEAPVSVVPFPGALPRERCPFYEAPAPAEVQAHREARDEHMEKTFAALRVASKWRTVPKPSEDRAEVVECPLCKGRLHLTQSSYNGHVHGKCETAGCVSWME